jgi:hypothetical protein
MAKDQSGARAMTDFAVKNSLPITGKLPLKNYLWVLD